MLTATASARMRHALRHADSRFHDIADRIDLAESVDALSLRPDALGDGAPYAALDNDPDRYLIRGAH